MIQVVFYVYALAFATFGSKTGLNPKEIINPGVEQVDRSKTGLNLVDQEEVFGLYRHLQDDVSSSFKSRRHTLLQSEFLKVMKEEDYKKALDLWSQGINKKDFHNFSTGQALYAFLIFQSGLPITGLNELFRTLEPKKIHLSIQKLWKMHIDHNHFVWNYAILKWSPQWTKFFDGKIATKVGSRQAFNLKKDRDAIKYLLRLPEKRDVNKVRLEWKFVLSALLTNDVKLGTKTLEWLIKNPKGDINRDFIYLTIGRLLSDIDRNESAISYYNKVQKSSPYILKADEEVAWILYKMGKFEEALFRVAYFNGGLELLSRLTPRMMSILSLAQLKTCSYDRLGVSLGKFINELKNRDKILKIAFQSQSLDKRIKDLKTQDWHNLEGDKILIDQMALFHFMKEYDMKASSIKPVKSRRDAIVRQLEKDIYNRIGSHISLESKEVKKAIKILKLVELESLYRIYGFHNFDKRKTTFDKSIVGNNQILFPVEKNAFWYEEKKFYKMTLKKDVCPKESYVL